MVRIDSLSSVLKTIFLFVLIACLFNTIATTLGLSFPYTTFITPSGDLFADFFKVMDALNITETWKGENQYHDIGINFLPPFAIAVYAIMALFLKYVVNLKFLTYLFVFIIPLAIVIKKSPLFRNPSNYWFLILFSYPLLQIMARGNLAALVFFFLTLSILKIKNIVLSALFLAFAVSVKITPVIFFLYIIVYHKSNIKRILISGVLFVMFLFLINLISIEVLSLSVSKTIYDPSKFFTSIKKYEDIMVYNFAGMPYCSSFYMAFRSVFYQLYKIRHLHFISALLNIKPLLINLFVVFFFLVLYFLRQNYASFKNLVTDENVVLKVCSVIFILFTPITADYYLSILFLPLFFVPFSKFSDGEKVLYILLLIPKNYFFFHGYVSLQVYINPLLLLLLLTEVSGIFRFNFPSHWFKEKNVHIS